MHISSTPFLQSLSFLWRRNGMRLLETERLVRERSKRRRNGNAAKSWRQRGGVAGDSAAWAEVPKK